MVQRFNLIATTFRGMEIVSASELSDILRRLGDSSPEVQQTKIAGLLTARTNLNPIDVVEKLKSLVKDEPWLVRNLQRIIPIEDVVETDKDKIARSVAKLAVKIPEDQSFRVTVEKRHTQISSKDIIEAAASVVNRKVNLDNPDWIVLIEVLGGVTGVSVIKPDQIFSLSKHV